MKPFSPAMMLALFLGGTTVAFAVETHDAARRIVVPTVYDGVYRGEYYRKAGLRAVKVSAAQYDRLVRLGLCYDEDAPGGSRVIVMETRRAVQFVCASP